jgi:hypothetical protein
MKIHLTWLAAAVAAIGVCAGAAAQSRDVNCIDDGAVSASGTSAAPGHVASPKRSKAASLRVQHLARERGTLPVAFPTCAAKTDRTARAECVSSALEARRSATLASASGRRPC